MNDRGLIPNERIDGDVSVAEKLAIQVDHKMQMSRQHRGVSPGDKAQRGLSVPGGSSDHLRGGRHGRPGSRCGPSSTMRVTLTCSEQLFSAAGP